MEVIKNALIKSAVIDSGDMGLLTAWLHLDYGGSGQGFGGYALYLPKSYKHTTKQSNFAGHFLYRCMEIAGVGKWSDLVGKTIRVKTEGEFGKILAIGNILRDDWFVPEEDFALENEIKRTIENQKLPNQFVAN